MLVCCGGLALVLSACASSSPGHAAPPPAGTSKGTTATTGGSKGGSKSKSTSPSKPPSTSTTSTTVPGLAAPAALTPFPTAPAIPGEGSWAAAGRPVQGRPAVYETTLVPPGGTQPAGIAWMDTRLLSARLYSGSLSPGGGPYTYTAPIQPAQATSLVAAFNGGFQMKTAGGGYYTTGTLVDPLVQGAASLVISTNGTVTVGAWGSTVSMTPAVASVRQNLTLLVSGGKPTALASSADWQAWGFTCGATSCTPGVPGIEHQWRSGVGVTADGALVYVNGPSLAPVQLADLLVRAGVVRGMELDINPDWPVFATYDPATPNGLATPSNGKGLLSGTIQGPATFFDPSWNRDFITMSARAASS